jgi:hypothetical protein
MDKDTWGIGADDRPRWKRRLDDFHRNSRIFQWGIWPAFWFAIHSQFNNLVFGDPGPFGDWGHGHASIMAIHRWFCRRWVPAWYRAELRKRLR